MSYKQKQTLVSILSGLLILAAYCTYALVKVQSSSAQIKDLRFWAISMLIFIGIGITASIVIQIVFHIALSVGTAVRKTLVEGETDSKAIERSIKIEMTEDEMDKLIELKSSRVGFIVIGVGFLASLLTLVFNIHPAVMLNILFVSCSLGSILEGFVRMRYYIKGIRNG